MNRRFCKELNDIISFGLHRYKDKYNQNKNQGVPFVLYEQYSRRDICFLMNCEKDLSSVMYGMKRIEDDVFIFVTYHKKQTKDASKKYVDGKPDYTIDLKVIKYFVGIPNLVKVLIVLIARV